MAKNAIRKKFCDFVNSLDSSMIERSGEIEMLTVALLTNEHCLMVGEPGTGKTLLSGFFARFLDGDMFSILLNKFTTLEELFGPVSFSGLKNDTFERKLDGKAADAGVLVLDEIFKGSSSILNATLALLNERVFHNGGKVVDCPLRIAVGLSNEWPEDDSLNALFDRFLYRKIVDPIQSESGVDRLMFGDIEDPVFKSISESELNAAQKDVAAVSWSQSAKNAFTAIRKECMSNGIIIGDRRLRKSVGACKAVAWLDGRDEVTKEDLMILQHILWVDPAEQPKLVASIVMKHAAPELAEVNSLIAASEEIVKDLNTSDMASLLAAHKKLVEIEDKIGDYKSEKAVKAAERIKELVKQVLMFGMEAAK